MMPDGYGLWWRGVYCVSVTTGPARAEGRHDLYFGPAGADGHEHVWLQLSDASVARAGARLKVESSPGFEVESLSTGVLARLRLVYRAEADAVEAELTDVFSGIPHTAGSLVCTRTTSQRAPERLEIDSADDADSVTCVFALCRRGQLPAAKSVGTTPASLDVGPGSPFGVAVWLEWSSTGG